MHGVSAKPQISTKALTPSEPLLKSGKVTLGGLREALKSDGLRGLCDQHTGLAQALQKDGLIRVANDLDRTNALQMAMRSPGETIDFKGFGERFRGLQSATNQVEDLGVILSFMQRSSTHPLGLRGDIAHLAHALSGIAEDVNRCRTAWGGTAAADAQQLSGAVATLVDNLKANGFVTADGTRRKPNARELAAFEPLTRPATWNKP